MMGVYLEDNPPARSQFRRKRRATVTGSVVVHTSESNHENGPFAVARFIQRRSTPGSYHTIVGSDEYIQLVPYDAESYGEGTGGNRWALHLSFACKAAQWSTLPKQWVDGAVHEGAIAAAEMCDWINQQRGFKIPPRRISPAEYRAGKPGFIGHGELDPGRRSDPGADFPWEMFLTEFAEHTDQADDAAPWKPGREELVMELQRVLLAHGAQNLGHTGPNKDGVDGDAGAGTVGDAITIITSQAQRITELEQEVVDGVPPEVLTAANNWATLALPFVRAAAKEAN